MSPTREGHDGRPQGAPGESQAQRRPLVSTQALDLDDLLAEMRRRADGARQAHERVTALLDAVVAIGSDLELTAVLDRILASACSLVDARYGALGVLDHSHDGLAEFRTVGVDAATCARIGGPPRGLGVLGHLIREPRVQRIDDVPRHASAAGFPPHHPAMHTFIGAPLRVRERVFGNLYLTEKRGGGAFTADDEVVLEALATAAGIAIENADLYRREQERREWAQAVGDVTRLLLQGPHEGATLSGMVRQVCALTGATGGSFASRGAGEAFVVDALHPGHPGGRPAATLADPWWASAVAAGTPHLIDHPTEPTARAALRELRGATGGGAQHIGPTVVAPMTVGAVEVGLLTLTWPPGAHTAASRALMFLGEFAGQLGLAIETGRAQRQRSRVTLMEERDRIGRDMHDHVIQRLYGAGLSLQVAARGLDDDVSARLGDVVGELDGAIKDIRSAIFHLHRSLPDGGLGAELEALVKQAGDTTGHPPDLRIDGLLSDVPPELEHDVLAVVREGLSNIVRHSEASSAHVHLCTLDDIVVTITDDGIGIDDSASLRGLDNLAARAHARGGAFSVSRCEPRGTLLRWRVPLPATSDDALAHTPTTPG